MRCNTHTLTHTHVLPSSWILSGITQVSWHQKGKTNFYLLEQDIVSGSEISWAISKSAPWPRHISMPASHYSVFSVRMPFLPPNQQRQSTEGTFILPPKVNWAPTPMTTDVLIGIMWSSLYHCCFLSTCQEMAGNCVSLVTYFVLTGT